MRTVLQVVSWLAYSVICFDGGSRGFLSMPELQPLLTVPEFPGVFATMLVVSIEALLAQQKLGPTAAANASRTTTQYGTGSSSSTESSGLTSGSSSTGQDTVASSSTPSTNSSSSSSRATSKASAKLNWKLESVLRNLPECTKALLETLGMDSRAMVWAAAAQRDIVTAEDLDSIAVTLVHVLCWQDAAALMAQQQAERPKLQKLLLMVPAVLLHWAANIPVLTDPEVLHCAVNAAFRGQRCIQTWLQLDSTAYAQIVRCGFAGLHESSEVDALRVAPEPWLQPYLPAVWLEQVLPDLQQLLEVLLPHCWKQPQAEGTASCSPDPPTAAADVQQHATKGVGQQFGSMQSSSITGDTARTVQVSEVLPGLPGWLIVLQCRVLQSAVGNTFDGYRIGASESATTRAGLNTGVATDNPCGSSSSSSSSSSGGGRLHQLTKPLAEFRKVTVQTLASFEGFIRASAQQLAAGSMLNCVAILAISVINAAVMSNGHTVPGPLLSLAAAAGPGSPEQQQLYSLLSSLIKLSALGANGSDAAFAEDLSRTVCVSCIVTSRAAIRLLEVAHEFEGQDSSSSGSSTAKQHPGVVLSLSEAAAGSLPAVGPTAPTTDAQTLLPSLVLVGRCCLLWAQHLQQAVPQLLRVHAGMGTVPPQQALKHRSFSPSAAAVVMLCFSIQQDPEPKLDSESSAPTDLQRGITYVSYWLTTPAVAAQLAAAGHDTQQLPELLQQLLSAWKTAAEAWYSTGCTEATAMVCAIADQLAAAGHDTKQLPLLLQQLLAAGRTAAEAWPSDNFNEATAMDLVQQLQVTGRALAGLAVPTMCCNPSCNNITGPSDLQLVSGRSCLCGGCRTARYCSRTCQKAAWKQHKPSCSALAAAAAAAAGTGAAAEHETEPQATS